VSCEESLTKVLFSTKFFSSTCVQVSKSLFEGMSEKLQAAVRSQLAAYTEDSLKRPPPCTTSTGVPDTALGRLDLRGCVAVLPGRQACKSVHISTSMLRHSTLHSSAAVS
jgi:hypothetical protein